MCGGEGQRKANKKRKTKINERKTKKSLILQLII
jgi:hypothetical protein